MQSLSLCRPISLQASSNASSTASRLRGTSTLRVKLTKAKPLSCPFDFPDVLLDEVSFQYLPRFPFGIRFHNQLFVVLSSRSCAVCQLKSKFSLLLPDDSILKELLDFLPIIDEL
jgi:hypothetical protein